MRSDMPYIPARAKTKSRFAFLRINGCTAITKAIKQKTGESRSGLTRAVPAFFEWASPMRREMEKMRFPGRNGCLFLQNG